MKAYGHTRRDKLTCKYGCCTTKSGKKCNCRHIVDRAKRKAARRKMNGEIMKFLSDELIDSQNQVLRVARENRQLRGVAPILTTIEMSQTQIQTRIQSIKLSIGLVEQAMQSINLAEERVSFNKEVTNDLVSESAQIQVHVALIKEGIVQLACILQDAGFNVQY